MTVTRSSCQTRPPRAMCV